MGSRSWGIELWDQTENILKYSSDGLCQLDQVNQCILELSKIHSKHGKHHKQLLQKFQSKVKSNRDVEESSYIAAFNDVISVINKMGMLHDDFAEALKRDIAGDLRLLQEDLKKKLEKQRVDHDKHNYQMRRHRQNLENTQRKYRQAYKDMLKSKEFYKLAEEDQKLSRADLDKSRNTMESKQSEFDMMKQDYAVELNKFNDFQRIYYSKQVPDWAAECEIMDRERLLKTSKMLSRTSQMGQDIVLKLQTCHLEISKAADKINVEKDSCNLIKSLSSGKPYPGDEVFYDLEKNGDKDSTDNVSTVSSTFSTKNPTRQSIGKALFSRFKQPKTPETDFSGKQLEERIEEMKHSIISAQKDLDGLMKMKKAYQSNPQMGDPVSVDPRIDTTKRRLQSLQEKLKHYERGRKPSITGASNGSKSHSIKRLFKSRSNTNLNDKKQVNGESDHSPNTSSLHQGSLDSDEFDDDFIEANSPSYDARIRSNTHQPSPAHSASNREPSLNTSSNGSGDHHPPHEAGDSQQTPKESPTNKEETEPTAYVGSCTALYAFKSDAEDAGYLEMAENDQFYIIDLDDGSGWTLVETLDGQLQGFIPTAYVQIQTY